MRSREAAQRQQLSPGLCAVPHSLGGPSIAYESLDQRGHAMNHAARSRPKLVGEAGGLAASAEQSGKVIELEAVSGRYGLGRSATTALDETTLDVRKGEVISFVGPSGCGKSTILRLVSGLVRPTTGVVVVGGRGGAASTVGGGGGL